MTTEWRSWSPDWRRLDCLANCGELVKRARHSWVEIGGTRSGSWLIGTRVNVGRAFAVKPGSGPQVSGSWVVLVDDVVTTGATLSGCANALYAADAHAVSGLALARER